MKYTIHNLWGFIFALISIVFLTWGCTTKVTQLEPYLPLSVLGIKKYPIIYLNYRDSARYVFDTETFVNKSGIIGTGSANSFFGNYAENETVLKPVNILFPQSLQVYPVSTIFLVQYKNYTAVQEQDNLITIEYSSFDTQDFSKFNFGDGYKKLMLHKKFNKEIECPLYVYDPEIINRLKMCEDGMYVFLYPLVVITDKKETAIFHTADIAIKDRSEIYPLRLVYRYKEVNPKKMREDLVNSELFFALHTLAFLRNEYIQH